MVLCSIFGVIMLVLSCMNCMICSSVFSVVELVIFGVVMFSISR